MGYNLGYNMGMGYLLGDCISPNWRFLLPAHMHREETMEICRQAMVIFDGSVIYIYNIYIYTHCILNQQYYIIWELGVSENWGFASVISIKS